MRHAERYTGWLRIPKPTRSPRVLPVPFVLVIDGRKDQSSPERRRWRRHRASVGGRRYSRSAKLSLAGGGFRDLAARYALMSRGVWLSDRP
jgi:ribosomal protein L39E